LLLALLLTLGIFTTEGKKIIIIIIILIIIIIICEFIRRTMSTGRLNLRRQQSLGGDDGAVK